MKKKAITFAIICFLLTTVCGQTIDFRAEVFNGVDNENTVITISHTQYGTYFLESKTESGTSLGRICIGYDRSEAKKALKQMEYFVTTDELTYILIEPGVNVYLKMYKEEEYTPDFENYFNNFITDGTEITLLIPTEFIKKARKKLI